MFGSFVLVCGFLCFAGVVVSKFYDSDDSNHKNNAAERFYYKRKYDYHMFRVRYHARKAVEAKAKMKRK